MFFYFLLMFLIQGFRAEDEEQMENCNHLYPEELNSLVISDAEMLPIVCQKAIDYLECEERALIKKKSSIEPVFVGIKDVVTGICEKDSKMQKDYLASADCFKDFENYVSPCYEAAQKIYLDYRLFITRFDEEGEETSNEELYSEEENKDTVTYHEPYCMMSAYAIGCYGTKFLDTCGRAARDTFTEIIQRSKILTQYCPGEERDKLVSEFLDFLTLEKEHSHIDLFRDVFSF